jgi:hypothetical protein
VQKYSKLPILQYYLKVSAFFYVVLSISIERIIYRYPNFRSSIAKFVSNVYHLRLNHPQKYPEI